MKILLVEDNELNRDMLSRRLERKKFTVICAKDGQSGIDIARRVVKNKQHEKGLDLTTANFIMQIYDAYKKNPRLQKKLDKMPLLKMVKLAHLVMK